MADEARSQRQAALADKKRRLDELKARRNQRGSTATQADGNIAKAKAVASTNLDDYIDGLLKAPASTTPAPAEAATAAPNASEQQRQPQDANKEAPKTIDNVIAEAAPAPMTSSVKHVETFEMSTQTAEDDFPPPSDYDEDELQQEPVEEGAYDADYQEPSYRNYYQEEYEPEEAKVLSAEEVEKELSSETFSTFLNAASKKVERVLGSPVLADLFSDYAGQLDGSKRVENKASDGSKFISSRQIYECAKWTATRDVTDMDWSPLHRELMLTSYHMPSSTSSLTQASGSSAVSAVSPDDTPSSSLAPRSGELLSDGLALVWSLAMPTRPEHIFTCGSPVTTARFHPTESPLVIGGCQSGQVVVWDVRAGRMPVQKSSLTTTASGGKGHTHPIVAMEIIEGGVSRMIEMFLQCRNWRLNLESV
jgi:dynein intermediate chain